MSRQDRSTLDLLGTAGLERALEGLLDHARLVKLANAAGVSYPGMRARSRSRETLVHDLARRALEDTAAAREILRVLRKDTAARRRAWATLDAQAWIDRLADRSFLEDRAESGAAVFLIASGALPAAGDGALDALLRQPPAGTPKTSDRRGRSTGAPPPSRDDDDRDRARLDKKLAEATRKARHQSEQLRRLRETERALRRDLMERKGELAETRMALERARKEVDAVTGVPDPKEQESAALTAIASVGRAVRRVATAQREHARQIEELGRRVAADRGRGNEPFDPNAIVEALEALRKDASLGRRSARKGARERDRRLDELADRVEAFEARLDEVAVPRPERRPSVGKARVGVFIDVQNVFYGARQLKGKLDFDALLEAAVRDRRLIVARAYVVETKEIDQSGFIAVLEHRGIQVRRKNLRVRADGSMKGDWDMEMALDILDAAPALDVVVLVSGDGDFASLVGRVKGMGPRVEVLAFPRTTAKALIEAADHFHPLDRNFMIRSAAKTSGATGDRAAHDDDGAASA